jgi:hypothetical protein
MTSLTPEQFRATFKQPMHRVPVPAVFPIDFLTYFDAIPSADFDCHICPGHVRYVWEDASGRYQHVLFNSEEVSVFMVVVLDMKARWILGHHLLDLRTVYSVACDENISSTDEAAVLMATSHDG